MRTNGSPYGMRMGDEEGREGMDELVARRERPRIAALMARVDAGELEALDDLERRLHEDYRYLVVEGKPELADAAWGWGLARVEDGERTEEFADREEAADAPLPEAPACWRGLRIRVSYTAGGGAQRPSELAGRLAEVTERGIRVSLDELEEERDGDDPTSAGSIARRVRAERFLTWGSLLTVQPLPVSAVGEGA